MRLLATALLSIGHLSSGAIILLADARNRTLATMLAVSRLEELRASAAPAAGVDTVDSHGQPAANGTFASIRSSLVGVACLSRGLDSDRRRHAAAPWSRRSRSSNHGRVDAGAAMTLAELLVAACVTTLVAGAAVATVAPLQRGFAAHPEAANLAQRTRVVAELLSSDRATRVAACFHCVSATWTATSRAESSIETT